MVHSYALGKWLLLIPLLSFCIVVFGDTTQGSGSQRPPPTLQEVVESAYSRHPQLQTFDAQKEEANALESRAGSLIAGNPSLAASYKTDQIGSDEGFREWEAGIVMPLWKSGQRDAARQTVLSAITCAEP